MNRCSFPAMRRHLAGLAVVLVTGCGGPQAQRPASDVVIVERTTEPTCPAPAGDDSRKVAQRARIARELAAVDRELDQIDDELAAAALPVPASRDAAINALAVRIASLQRTAPEALFADTPALLIRIAYDYATARERDVELGVSYGERHPTRVEQRAQIDALRTTFERQREVEVARATTSRDQLANLPRSAPVAKIRQADLRALQQTIARFADDAVVPSDAPVDVRVAALRLAEAHRKIDAASPSLGPKHPEMVVLKTELAAARARMQTTLTAAEAALAASITALDSSRSASRSKPDPSRLARRAELAARARDLRREWDAYREP